MESRRSLRFLCLVAICAAVSGCAGIGGGPGREPRMTIASTTGEFQVTNSRDGQAIFQASGLAPGGSVTGTVQLANSGVRAGDLALRQIDVADQPGANGGLLSSAVVLDVADVTGGGLIPVYAGQLGAFGTQALGNIAPGQARTYRFTASLPDGGEPPTPTSGDNAYLGSGMTVRYAWTATAPDDPPTGGGGGGTGGGGTGGGGTGGGGGGSGGRTGAPVVKFTVNSKKVLTRGWLDVRTTCDRACRVDAWAQLPKVKAAGKPKGKRGKKVKPLQTKHRKVTLNVASRGAVIRLKVNGKGKRQLKRTLRKKKKVVLSVTLKVTTATGTDARTYLKKVVVKRPKKTKKRR